MKLSSDSRSQPAGERFAEEYSHLTTDELLNLRGESASLTSDARKVLKKEMTRRGLDRESLKLEPDAFPLPVINANGTMTPIRCLDDWETYSRLVNRKIFMQKYYRLLILVPFGIAVLMTSSFFPMSRAWFASVPMYLSFIWISLVLVYTFWLVIRVRAIRCPRCGGRFGSEDECIPCGFPRHATQAQMQDS
jgi:hypothetical protein